MKGVFLFLCLVLIQLSWTEAEQQTSGSEVSEALVRQIRQPKKAVKKKSKATGRKNIKNKGGKNSKGSKNPKGRKNIKNKVSKNSKGRKNIKSRERKNSKGRKIIINKGMKNRKSKGRKIIKSKERKNSKSNRRKNIKTNGKNNSKSKGSNNIKSKIRRKGKGKKHIKRKGKKIEEKKYGGMKPEADRLTGEECFAKLCERNKKFNLYQTQLRKAKRILSWVSQMDNKKAKAPTTFQNASLNIIEATENGTQCGGGLISDDVKIANDKLQTCNTTATDMCTSSKIGLNTSLITECIPKLQKFVDDYKTCLRSCDCDCFDALTLVDDSCTKFNDMETKTKAAKNKCTKPSEEGSFGYCRQQERVVASKGFNCKSCPATTTTKAPGGRHQFSARRILQRLKERM